MARIHFFSYTSVFLLKFLLTKLVTFLSYHHLSAFSLASTHIQNTIRNCPSLSCFVKTSLNIILNVPRFPMWEGGPM